MPQKNQKSSSIDIFQLLTETMEKEKQKTREELQQTERFYGASTWY
ncbi:hypothetical protein KAU93_00715 [Candidatus Bathyarchaeota archaeon]|nr:hypothetical protein [Candidatus Bathyarchaeota archaeon]